MFTILIYVATLAALSNAAPAPVSNDVTKRAGGPAITPIPSTCNISYPIQPLNPDGFLPAASTTSSNFYSAYYSLPDSNKTALAEQCLEQCYGYGDHTDCKTAYWAENVVVPAGYYGGPGGDLAMACLFYNQTLSKEDLVAAPPGQDTTPFVGNLQC